MQTVTAADISHPISSKVTTQLKDIQKTLPLRVLSEEDWQHWITKGYVIVRQAISRDAAARLARLTASMTCGGCPMPARLPTRSKPEPFE